jgi:hypothetical protein
LVHRAAVFDRRIRMAGNLPREMPPGILNLTRVYQLAQIAVD